MKKILSYLFLLVFVPVALNAAIGTRTRTTAEFDEYTVTFGASVVDTIKWVRPAGVNAVSIGVYAADTIDFSATSSVRRIVKGVAVTAITADTLANIEALAGTDYLVPVSALDAVTLAPLAEEYWFIWTMHSSANGVGTANTMTVRIYKHLTK